MAAERKSTLLPRLAARSINTNGTDSGTVAMEACATEVAEGESYMLSAAVLFPNGASQSRVTFSVSGRSGANCTETLAGVSSPQVLTSAGFGVWRETKLVVPFVAPMGTNSISVRVVHIKDFAADNVADVVFDRVRLTAASWIFSEDFEVGEPCRWSLTQD